MGETYTMTIDDASSIINWHPQGDGGLGNLTADGWQPFYSGSPGGFTTRGGEAALGNSMHITAFPNASFDFQFYGTSVSLFGIANCSYEVSVDGNSTTSLTAKRGQSTQLFSQDGLKEGVHSVSLTANASRANEFAFERADVSRPIAASAQIPAAHVYQATNTSFIQYSGNWTILNDPLIPNQQHPAPYFEVENAPASFSFAFQGVGVAINGSRIWGSYAYDVTLDDQSAVTYNASTMWFIGDTLLYYQDGLDPTKTHTVTVLPTVGAGLKFWLNTITVFTDDPSEAGGLASTPTSSTQPLGGATSNAPSSSGSSKTNAGAIAGGVIGGLAFIALVAGLLWYFARRRRQNPKVFDREQPSPFLATASTPAPMVQASPYVPTQHSPYTPPRGDTKLPILAIGSDGHVPSHTRALPALPSGSGSSSAPSESGRTVSEHSLAHGSAAQVAAMASPTTTHASSPAESNPDPNVAVDRIIHLLAERMATRPPRQSVYGTDVPPPEYGA